ncbi:MAG: hypothetical protein WBA16_08005 [Nonlabens sp.]
MQNTINYCCGERSVIGVCCYDEVIESSQSMNYIIMAGVIMLKRMHTELFQITV